MTQQCGLPVNEMVAYLRALAERIERAETPCITLMVDAHGRSTTVTYGHANAGAMFQQIEHELFVQRMAFLLPQIMPQIQAASAHIMQSRLGSS